MALKPLATITTLPDILAYAQAEARDAASQCPGAYADYNAAVQTALQWNAARSSLDATAEQKWVETVRQLIYGARETWYNVGCANLPEPETRTGGVVAPPSSATQPPPVQAGLGGGNIGTLLLVGAGVFGLLYLLDKGRKGKGRKTSARRKTTRRRAASRRRRAPSRRRR
jgi:hypothetical protein